MNFVKKNMMEVMVLDDFVQHFVSKGMYLIVTIKCMYVDIV